MPLNHFDFLYRDHVYYALTDPSFHVHPALSHDVLSVFKLQRYGEIFFKHFVLLIKKNLEFIF